MSRGTPTQRDVIRRLLREAGARGITTSELLVAGAGVRYSARVLELREQGYEIVTERIGPGQARYRLVREPERPTPPAPRSDQPEQPDQGARLFDGFERRPLGYGEDV